MCICSLLGYQFLAAEQTPYHLNSSYQENLDQRDVHLKVCILVELYDLCLGEFECMILLECFMGLITGELPEKNERPC